MAKTLLAVDDSVTMRKVLEITFGGEDFRVITADSGQAALGKLGENPNVFVVDTVLGNEDGYALAREIRKRSPQAPIIMLASRYSPYDQARGRDAGADDWSDKPFDTQQLIDKVRKVIVAKEAGGPIAAALAPIAPPAPAPPAAAAAPMRSPAPPMGIPRGTQPSLGGSAPARTGTLVFGEQSPLAAAPSAPAAAPPPAPRPAPPAAMAPSAPAPVAAHVQSAVNGQLAGKLGQLGLTSQQADAVMALSRDVIERVVWEVVPNLAEALIKEEIARLMKE